MTTKTTTKAKTVATKAGDQEIRDYLTFLKDPKALVDSDAVAKARSALEAETDPLAQMALFDKLCGLEQPNGNLYEEKFISCAAEWVQANSINNPAAVFLKAGVSRGVIAKAGFAVERTRTPRSAIEAAIPPSGVFTVGDVATASGASYGPTSKTIKSLVESGVLTARGPVDGHTGPGRSPLTYEKV